MFGKIQTLFKKLEYHFLAESTNIDNIIFPYETALSEVEKRSCLKRIRGYNTGKERGSRDSFSR